MTNNNCRSLGLVAAIFFASIMSMAPAFATEHEKGAEEKSEHHKIKPIPGLKGCLHHVAQYDDAGNFTDYKTVRGPCH